MKLYTYLGTAGVCIVGAMWVYTAQPFDKEPEPGHLAVQSARLDLYVTQESYDDITQKYHDTLEKWVTCEGEQLEASTLMAESIVILRDCTHQVLELRDKLDQCRIGDRA